MARKTKAQKAAELASAATSAFTDAVSGLNEANRLLDEDRQDAWQRREELYDLARAQEERAADDSAAIAENRNVIEKIEGLLS